MSRPDDGKRRNLKPLSLHVPEPDFRPGDAVDFSAFDVPVAGAVARPPIETAPEAMRDHVYQMVRVLDDEGRAVGPWASRIDPDQLRRMLGQMLLLRAFDERMHRSQRQGKTSFYVRSTGEEATSIGAAHGLDYEDMCFPSYRQQGLLIARGWSIVDMMCQIFSNRGDRMKGRQMPVMYSARAANFFTLSGNLATQYPQAVGWAMASAIKGDTRIAATWCGEGSTAEGDFHSAMMFASVYRAPVVLNIINNQWAISSFSGFAGGEATTFAARAIGYGVAGLRVDGNDILAVHAATSWAAERARNGHGPTLIEHFTYRAEGHSTSDDPTRYRAAEEKTLWPLGDPIERLKAHLVALGEWDEARHEALAKEKADEVKAASREAEALGVLGDGLKHHAFETMFEDVFEEITPELEAQRDQMIAERKAAGL